MTGRGVLTTKVRVKALETLGREITTAELRLMPYLLHLALDWKTVDPRKVNQQERAILHRWRQAGWIEGGASSRIIIKRDFWRAITELLYFAYIAEAD
jgi:hypothetical protein